MSGLFGGKSQSTAPTRYNGIQLSRSAYGQPVPLLYGQTRAQHFMMWYGNFVSTPNSQSGGGKGGGGQPSSYSYSAAIMLGICEGPIAGYASVYDGAAIHTNLGDLNLSQLALGTTGQAVWSYLSSNFPSQAIPYSNVAYVASNPYNLGSSAGMPNLTFEVKGLLQYGGGIIDAEPSAMIVDYMTDPNHGANFPYVAPLTGANSFQQYCVSMGMFVSYYEDQQRPAADFLKEVLQICNSAGVVRGNGQLALVPYADAAVSGNGGSYTPNLTPIYAFTDDDYCPAEGEDPVVLTRQPYTQTFNVVPVEYLDRSNSYNTAIASAYDDGDVALNGTRPMSTTTLHAITNATLAKLVAQLMLQRNLYYRNQYAFKLRGDYALLEPMDFVALNETTIGLNDALCRVLEVDESASDGTLSLTVEEVPLGPATAPLYNWQAVQGYNVNRASAPGAVFAPYIFLVPAALSTDGQARIGVAVGGPNNGLWGGCYVWVSFDGTNYERMGTVTNSARYGTLTSSLASGSDPDTTNTLAVTLNDAALTMSGGAQADADQMRTLCMVDGELISYETATLVSSGKYNLGTYLRRGCYGSTIGAHAANANWARLDQAVVTLPLDPGMLGMTISFKFQSFNVYGQGVENLASDTVYTYAPSTGQTAGTGQLWTCQGTAVAQDNRVFKGSNGASAWDSNASGKSITGAVWVQGRVTAAARTAMLGLSTSPSTASYTGGNFNMGTAGGALSIWESGTNVANPGSVANGDLLEIRYDGQTTYYYQNGVLVWTTRKPLPQTTPISPTVYLEQALSGFYDLLYGAGFNASNQNGANFLSNVPWLVGSSGNQALFFDEAASLPNPIAGAIVLGDGSAVTLPLGPWGTSEVLWQVQGNSAAGTWGGFYNPQNAAQAAPYLGGDISGIDPSKTYRFSCWFRYHAIGGGTPEVFFGLDTNGITIDINGHTVDSNPYFAYCQLGNLTADKWYLATGILHGSSLANSTQSGLTGIWDPVTGQRVSAANGFANGANVAFGADFQQKPGACGQSIRAVFSAASAGGANTFYGWFCKPRFEELNGNEPSIWSLMHPTSTVDPSSGVVLPLGCVPPIVPGASFSWTSTPTTIDITWPSFTLYRADGSTTTAAAGGVNITGLTASTTYSFYPFYSESAGTVQFASVSGATGSPAVAYASPSVTGLQASSLFNCVPLNNFTVATPASGGGSGGGGGVRCPHPDSEIETANRGLVLAGELTIGDLLRTPGGPAAIRGITRKAMHEWLIVRLKGGGEPFETIVTPEHVFYDRQGRELRAMNLRIGELLRGEDTFVRVMAIALLEREADAVVISLPEPHVYFERRGGVLSHNGNPKP